MIKKISKYFRNPTYNWQKSFSQSGEDIIIKFIFDAIGIINPSYIDVGAHHPQYLNNTAIFYEHGSTGINIEPDPNLYKKFVEARGRDINLNCGVGNKNEILDFYTMSTPTLNTFSEEEAIKLTTEYDFKIVSKTPIKVLTLDSIINQHFNGRFPDLLSIDVEGLDEAIIRSINYSKSAPTVICVETISYSETGNGVKNSTLIDFLKEQGYMLYADTYINSIFVLESKWKKSK
ncbi:MAG: FkbM family methyltransferase [Flavipsychrobacter sp.]